MKNIYDNYGIDRELMEKKQKYMIQIYNYNAERTVEENQYNLDKVVRKIICDNGLTDGHLLYVSSELDRLQWILFKLKKIPGLKRIVRKLEIESYR